MSEQQGQARTAVETKPDLRGTWKDWPAVIALVLLVIAGFALLSGGEPVVLLLAGAAAALVWVVRAFASQRR